MESEPSEDKQETGLWDEEFPGGDQSKLAA
jgi:hypothetical protein